MAVCFAVRRPSLSSKVQECASSASADASGLSVRRLHEAIAAWRVEGFFVPGIEPPVFAMPCVRLTSCRSNLAQ